MSADTIIKDVKKRMQGAVDACERDFQGIRTTRANPALLEHVSVEIYGARTPISQAATVGAPDARMLTVQVWDQGNVSAIEKAIAAAGLGLNPSADGTLIRVPMPILTEDRRKELVKIAYKEAEKSRISIRNVRRDGMDSLKKAEKAGEISEDDLRAYSDDIQKATDSHIEKVEAQLAKKEKDILN